MSGINSSATSKLKKSTHGNSHNNFISEAGRGNLSFVQKVIQNTPINSTDENGKTALNLAAENKQTSVVKYLLENHADPNIRDNGGFVALNHAVKNNDLEMAEVLLQHHADPNVVYNRELITTESTPLMEALNGKIKFVNLLLSYGADPNYQDKYQVTALNNAIAAGMLFFGSYPEIIKTLVAAGADPYFENKYGDILYEMYDGFKPIIISGLNMRKVNDLKKLGTYLSVIPKDLIDLINQNV